MPKLKLFFIGYILIIFGLFLYSYTQVDLNLTLSKADIWQFIQKKFQYIGWFQRPLSASIFLILLLFLTAFYLIILNLTKKNKLSKRQFWVLLGVSSSILLFSYNAFSYDLFNYMFDARIFTFHHNNPYFQKALDYPSDPWINFMRWTHRTYPYGPVWLGLTIPLSFLGFQFFLPTLFLFKALMTAGFLVSVFFIGKISEKFQENNTLFNMAFFAFNPLVIIESLVSAHHDIVMIAFALGGLFLFLEKKYFFSVLLLLFSGGVKFATFLILPIMVVFKLLKNKKIIKLEDFFLSIVFLMLIAIIFASIRTELQSWYLLWVLPFIAIANKKPLKFISVVFSIVLILNYVPFLFTGNWNAPIPKIKSLSMLFAAIISFFVLLSMRLKRSGSKI